MPKLTKGCPASGSCRSTTASISSCSISPDVSLRRSKPFCVSTAQALRTTALSCFETAPAASFRRVALWLITPPDRSRSRRHEHQGADLRGGWHRAVPARDGQEPERRQGGRTAQHHRVAPGKPPRRYPLWRPLSP